MKACRLLIPILLLAACGRPSQDGLAGKSATLDNAVSDPARRYFGLHFDFHASPDRSGGCSIGETLQEEDIRRICRELRPDFLQVDSKGHPGWASFPSRMGNAMPRFTGNPLQVWRQVTREEGVALYAHYSGVFDTRYKTLHPDESAKGPDGKPDKRAVRTNGSYADSLLIPQLCELALDYGLDGTWVDGECWAAAADYDPRTVAGFKKETGLDARIDSSAFRGYCRELFRRYLRHYVDSVHACCPDFKVCSNWAFSDEMPEAVCAGVDFLSGDFREEDSMYWARYTGRAICKQHRPWDLMAWSFRRAPGGHVPKHPVQLMQEAATILSLGGGFQVYVTQKRDGSPRTERVLELKPLADFVHARREWTFGGEPRKQAAVLLSTFDHYESDKGLFSRAGCESVMGLVNILCDAGRSVTLLSEHDLPDAAQYPVILVPGLRTGLAPETVDALKEYARSGGSLVLLGAKTAEVFGLGTEIPEAAQGVTPFGQGKLALVPEDLGRAYVSGARYEHRAQLTALLDGMYEPGVKVLRASGLLEVVDMEKDGRRLIQLINAGGAHHNLRVLTEDRIPPLTGIVLEIRTDRRPRAIRLQPEGRRLRFRWKEGVATVEIPSLEIHGTLEIKD